MMQRAADISSDGLYRWTLTRRWDDGGMVCWIMLNPSTADAETDDPTIRSIIKRSQAWGLAGLVVVNLWPFRSSSPLACREWAAPMLCAVRARRRTLAPMLPNASTIWREANKAVLTVAAWGSGAWYQEYAEGIAASLRLQNIELHSIGETQYGKPKHPLARGKHWVPEWETPQRWEARHDS